MTFRFAVTTRIESRIVQGYIRYSLIALIGSVPEADISMCRY